MAEKKILSEKIIKTFDKEYVLNNYYNREISVSEILDNCLLTNKYCSSTKFYQYLKFMGLETRINKEVMDREYIYNEYVNKETPIREILKGCRTDGTICSIGNFYTYLYRWNIPRRGKKFLNLMMK